MLGEKQEARKRGQAKEGGHCRRKWGGESPAHAGHDYSGRCSCLYAEKKSSFNLNVHRQRSG